MVPNSLAPVAHEYDDAALDHMINLAIRVQRAIPDAVLVGSLAACFHCRHRVPKMNVHLVRDMATRAEILALALESINGHARGANKAPWRVLRFIFGIETVLLDDFGMLPDDGKETKARRFSREHWPDNEIRRLRKGAPPIETECFEFRNRFEFEDGSRLTLAGVDACFREALADAALRGLVSDFVDCAALYDKVVEEGREPVDVLLSLHRWFPGEPRLLKRVLVAIRDPRPHNAGDGTLEGVLRGYKGFRNPYGDASFVRTRLGCLYEGTLRRLREMRLARRVAAEEAPGV